MGRPSTKVKEVEEADVNETSADVVEEVKDEVEVKPVVETSKEKGVSISITATFKTRTIEGDRITHKYKGAGKTVAEALETVAGSEEELVDEFNKPFPNINMLTNITVRTSAGYEFSRAVAPHVARDIFGNKNVALATRLLGL